MKNTRNILEKQIIRDISSFDTTILSELLSLLTDKQVFNALSDKNQESLNFYQLKGGEEIRAISNMKGVSNSYNTPERIDIPKGTTVDVPSSGTRMGDCFTKLNTCPSKSTQPIKHCRGYGYEGEKQKLKCGSTIGLRCGYKSAPYSLGKIDLRYWEIVKNN